MSWLDRNELLCYMGISARRDILSRPTTNPQGMKSEKCDPTDITEASLLVRISRLYREGMSVQDLYDTTRGVWALGNRRLGADWACAVVDGHVCEIYSIDQWHPAGTTAYRSRVIDLDRYGNRWEFTGQAVPDMLRVKYVGHSVAHYFPKGAANPVMYVNC